MSHHTSLFTGYLARAARALVEISAEHLAPEAGLTHDELRDFERGNTTLAVERAAALQAALEAHGAVFLADGEGGFGYGVRLKFSRTGSKRIDTWEGEGGPAAEDDV
ncbi:MAG: XRE family transcriptional regulator [Leucobacter sp.]|nr:XRE family transcriptional regulator [Leucobacter sp.]